MRIFLIRILFFLTILVMIFITNFAINSFIIQRSKIDLKSNNILIIGDSHLQYGLNPIYFSSAQNISQPAEDYMSSYWKIKSILNTIKLDSIILGFSFHNISAYNDLKYTDDRWSEVFFNRLYAINEFDKIKDIKINYLKYYKVLFRKMWLFPTLNHYNFIGQYSFGIKNDINDLDVAFKKYYIYDNDTFSFSSNSINYLKKIINLSKKNNIELILITTPIHHTYYDVVPNRIKQKHKSLKDSLINENILVLDYSNEFFEDSLFYNIDHLNGLGSNKLTFKLVDTLYND